MKKRIISLLVGGVIAVGAMGGLAACKDKDNTLTVWAPNNQQELVKGLVKDFLQENPDFGLEIEVGICGEDAAYATASKDVQASADVFGYANDQIMNLRKIGAVSRLGTDAVTKIKAENDATSVDTGKIVENGEEHYYGYPYAADNGFFMYYDSKVVSSTQAQTLEGVLEACRAANKYFLFNMNSQASWYLGSFFYGAGGDYTLDWEGTVLNEAGSNFDQKPEGSEYSYGQIAITALNELRKHEFYVTCDDTVISTYLTGKRLGACISGTWNATLVKQYLGDGYAATKLPTYHSTLTDKDYQLVPFIGTKLMGVNGYSKHPAEAHKLAAYLTSENAQKKRFEAVGTGPSNKAVAETEDVKKNVAVSAMMSQKSFAKISEAFPASYWSAFDALGTDIYGKEGNMTSDDITEKLKDFVKALKEE